MSRPDRAPIPVAGWVLPACLTCLFAAQVHAFHWGVITPDTVFQWGQALTGRYDDWHPPATTWLWRQLMPLGPGAAPVLIFDALLYWTGVWLIADTLRRRGRHRAMAGAVLCAALPIPFGQMGAILKDPLLAACCLTAAGLLLASDGTPPRRRMLAGAAACALLVFASATRFNAVFATAPLLACWMPRRWTQSLWKIAAVLAASAMVLAAGGWAIDNLALRPEHSQPIFSLVNFDLAGIVAHGGRNPYPDLDPATARRLTAQCYDPAQYNPAYLASCDAVEDNLAHYAALHGQSPAAILLHAIGASPLAYVSHRLAHLNRNWRFLVPDVPRDAVYVMTTENPYGLHFRMNGATRVVALAAQAMALSPLGRPATWIAVAIGLLLIGPSLRSRVFVIGTALSSICYGAAYLFVSVAPDMRYNLWTMLASMMALAVACAELGSVSGRLLAASAPCLLVIAGELAMLVGQAAG